MLGVGLVIGLRWMFDPVNAAAALGMTLLDEAGRAKRRVWGEAVALNN